jgi:hypothetical protein
VLVLREIAEFDVKSVNQLVEDTLTGLIRDRRDWLVNQSQAKLKTITAFVQTV